jgi:hypothetical protein
MITKVLLDFSVKEMLIQSLENRILLGTGKRMLGSMN